MITATKLYSVKRCAEHTLMRVKLLQRSLVEKSLNNRLRSYHDSLWPACASRESRTGLSQDANLSEQLTVVTNRQHPEQDRMRTVYIPVLLQWRCRPPLMAFEKWRAAGCPSLQSILQAQLGLNPVCFTCMLYCFAWQLLEISHCCKYWHGLP
jgi:hypothetical protein